MNTSSLASFRTLLMEQLINFWRHKWLALMACWLTCMVGWGAVMTMPRAYQSNARAFVDVNGLLTPLLKGLVVDTNTAQTSDYLRQTLLSRPNLEQVMQLAGLNAGKSPLEHEAMLNGLATRVSVRADGKNLVSISYYNSSPELAKNVVESLLTIFSEKAASSSRIEMEKARKFLNDQIGTYEEQLRGAEQRRADFRKQYADVLADPSSGAPRLMTLQQQVVGARQAYTTAVLTRDSLQAQLKQVPQFHAQDTPTLGPDGKIVAASPAVRLAQAKAALGDLRLKFTDQHPDVISTRKMVEELEKQVAELKASAAGSSSEGMSQINNPTYDQIRLRLVDAETAVPAARQRLSQAEAEFERMKRLSADMPDIDAKAKDLDRDYDVVKKNHDELVARRESATLSQAADDQADRTQFRIVDPPQLPIMPSSPNLPVMFSLVLLLGLGAGFALPVGIELWTGTFSSAERLRTLSLPVIGSVTLVRRPGFQRKTMMDIAAVAGCAAALLIAYGVLLLVSTGALQAI
jgi:polysaccharide chain length determinant protein (PEP-CTERM system associated)